MLALLILLGWLTLGLPVAFVVGSAARMGER